jgi:hypothetical protein
MCVSFGPHSPSTLAATRLSSPSLSGSGSSTFRMENGTIAYCPACIPVFFFLFTLVCNEQRRCRELHACTVCVQCGSAHPHKRARGEGGTQRAFASAAGRMGRYGKQKASMERARLRALK